MHARTRSCQAFADICALQKDFSQTMVCATCGGAHHSTTCSEKCIACGKVHARSSCRTLVGSLTNVSRNEYRDAALHYNNEATVIEHNNAKARELLDKYKSMVSERLKIQYD